MWLRGAGGGGCWAGGVAGVLVWAWACFPGFLLSCAAGGVMRGLLLTVTARYSLLVTCGVLVATTCYSLLGRVA